MLEGPAQTATPPANAEREVSAPDKELAANFLKRIEDAKKRHEEQFKTFEVNRKLLRGIDAEGKRIPANLYFANLATMRPQVYAKDPEYAVQPNKGVAQAQLKITKQFGATAEAVLSKVLVKDAELKKRAKRLLTAAYVTSVGWWKCCWQEDKTADPLIENQIKDTQDNLKALETLRASISDPEVGRNEDLKIAQLQQMLAGLQTQAEVSVARGLTLDFVMSEDILILDPSVREFGDYLRASAIAHRVWFTREKYKATFGCEAKKAKSYTEKAGLISDGGVGDAKSDLLCVYEVWDQDSNRVFTVCEGEEGFCKEPFSPDWTGKRWYSFFGLAFNEIEGTFYPLSDIELTQPQVTEINQTARDFQQDRKDARPLNVVRKGGTLTDADVQKLRDRNGADIVVVEGVGGQPLSNDIFVGALAQLKPEVYDTSQARSFMEQIVGGGDANRGSVLKAKTATEAEILNQGLRSRSGERQDAMEDLLTELGVYALQVLLRKLSPQEVKAIAGEDAVWPELTAEEVFEKVTLEVRGGSTGKPNELQEQDRWTKLMPVIEKTMEQVSKLREAGQEPLAQALIELARETLRRFDERIDIEEFLPPASAQGQPDPAKLAQENMMLKQQVQEMTGELQKAESEIEKAYISAATSIATSPNPILGAQAFGIVKHSIETGEPPEPGEPPQFPEPPEPSEEAGIRGESLEPPENNPMEGMPQGLPIPQAPQSAPQQPEIPE